MIKHALALILIFETYLIKKKKFNYIFLFHFLFDQSNSTHHRLFRQLVRVKDVVNCEIVHLTNREIEFFEFAKILSNVL